ncbi:diphthine methyl ester synthase [Condylostylus longicornis]|uniref:diphthine methyl ester synthase n=1 Tax=Condylostylus longicornis TaxID=2530218 RepID=UPI00244DFD49|nr:diphthine methyl ester synthase [Condylostylus longicornis]
MFYLIGLGLGDPKDITVRGLEIIKNCDKVFLEAYTSILCCSKEDLENFYGKPLIIADRDLVEQGAEEILTNAASSDVALLVVGDPFGATTHTDFLLRAKEKNIPYKVIHNASIINAVGCCGLQLYNFGETVSIPYWEENWKPDSFYDKIRNNRKNNMHTLCLLDIKVKEPTLESLTKKKKEYMPPRFMTVAEASKQLLAIIESKGNHNEEYDLKGHSLVIGLARVGHDSQVIQSCPLKEMADADLGKPLHSLVIPSSKLHPLENEYLKQFLVI